MVKENKIKDGRTVRLQKILEVIQSIASGNFSVRAELSVNADEIDSIACGINMLAEELTERTVSLEYVNNRIGKTIDIIQRVARGDYAVSCEISQNNDIFDALDIGINMMIDDIKTNIEEIKKLQSQFIQSEKMVAVGQLAGGVAHEINNPMGIILGFAQSIVKMIKEDDQLYMPLKSIEREAIRCKKLIEDLLTFSRTGKTQVEKTDINALVNDTLTLIQAQTKVKNIDIVKEYQTELPLIKVNKNQIQQVIVNLCNNAIDAMPEGGKITITTKQIDNQIEIDVSDTGKGMTEEIKKHVFEPFYTTKEVGKGTGLGLSLCHEIVKRHNGTIEIESEAGKGTTFKIKLRID